jgi:predicted RNase H-like HicB family nuclease
MTRSVPAYHYRISFSEEDGEYVATCDEVPGLSGLGGTPQDAVTQLETALRGWLEYLTEQQVPLPEPRSVALRVRVLGGEFRAVGVAECFGETEADPNKPSRVDLRWSAESLPRTTDPQGRESERAVG